MFNPNTYYSLAHSKPQKNSGFCTFEQQGSQVQGINVVTEFTPNTYYWLAHPKPQKHSFFYTFKQQGGQVQDINVCKQCSTPTPTTHLHTPNLKNTRIFYTFEQQGSQVQGINVCKQSSPQNTLLTCAPQTSKTRGFFTLLNNRVVRFRISMIVIKQSSST